MADLSVNFRVSRSSGCILVRSSRPFPMVICMRFSFTAGFFPRWCTTTCLLRYRRYCRAEIGSSRNRSGGFGRITRLMPGFVM